MMTLMMNGQPVNDPFEFTQVTSTYGHGPRIKLIYNCYKALCAKSWSALLGSISCILSGLQSEYRYVKNTEET